MAGKTQFHFDAGGFFPRLARAACEGARGVIDQEAADRDPMLQAAAVHGYAQRHYLGACTGVLGDPPADPAPPPSPPWSGLKTHAELNDWAEEQDLMTIPEDWFALTVEQKKAWLQENYPWP